MQYISPIRHGYFAIILNQFESETLHHYADIPGFLKTLGIVSNMAECFYCSCILMVCFSIGSLLMLYLAKKKQ